MAAKTPHKALRIREFRGSSQDFSVSFDPRKPLTLIYGENGSGKTTICDAFDFVGSSKVGSLANRGLGQLHPFWPTLGKSSGDILVELTIDGRTWTAQAKGREVVVTPADKSVPKIEILRRASLLQLVQDDPKERYAALKPFIDISVVEQAERELRDQIRDNQAELNETAARVGENEETLRRLMVDAGAETETPVSWARAIVSVSHPDTVDQSDRLRAAAQAIQSALTQARDVAEDREAAQRTAAASRTANEALKAAIEQSGAADAELVQVLTAAQQHFASHGVGKRCPLCESEERIEGLAEHVESRLTSVQRVRDASTAAANADRARDACQQTLESTLSKTRRLLADATTAIDAAPADWRRAHAAALSTISIAQKSKNDCDLVLDMHGLQVAYDAAQKACTALDTKSTQYSTTKTALEQYDGNVQRLGSTAKVLPLLKRTLEVCEAQRKQFLDGILGGIAQEVGRLYETIHPGEGLNKISLKLAPNKQGSLNLAAEFLGKQDQPPPAFFSESHLDSLGLCIFLALAGRQSPSSTIVVMDDVLGSIDEPHVDRLVQMLYEESKRFKHTIVTTHYQPWREKFRWGWLRNGQCELIELGAWSPSGGISTARLSQAPLFELRQSLANSPPPLQSACASAGVLLEAICDYLTLLYECDVPRRKGKLTLGDLLPKMAERKLAAALRVEVRQADGSYATVTLGDKLIRLREMMQLRNIFGCHYNDLAHSLPRQDALEFAQLVCEVGTALICDDEGWPGNDKSGSYWATKDETRRLHPLKKPT
jgi:hypothetical protein